MTHVDFFNANNDFCFFSSNDFLKIKQKNIIIMMKTIKTNKIIKFVFCFSTAKQQK